MIQESEIRWAMNCPGGPSIITGTQGLTVVGSVAMEDERDVSMCQEMPAASGSWKRQGKDYFLGILQKNQPRHTHIIIRLLTSRTVKSKCVVF